MCAQNTPYVMMFLEELVQNVHPCMASNDIKVISKSLSVLQRAKQKEEAAAKKKGNKKKKKGAVVMSAGMVACVSALYFTSCAMMFAAIPVASPVVIPVAALVSAQDAVTG